MRKLFFTIIAIALSGCATDASDRHTDSLRQSQHLRTERTLHMTFPEIQQALFRHDRECGDAPVFTMKEDESSYATITEANVDDMPWNRRILIDLRWLEPSIRQETRTRAEVYSFYSNAQVKQRISAMFAAIERPEACRSDD